MESTEMAAFAAALRDPDLNVPQGLLAPPGVPVDERFAIYRNNVHGGLIDALAERHPVVQALVGREFFRNMARVYVLCELPRTASLLHYGKTFCHFIRAFPPAGELPYLADVAELENAWQECWSAADATVLRRGELHGIHPEQFLHARLRVHPAARLLQSQWPAGSIWQCHQQDPASALESIHWSAENVLLTRPEADIRLLLLPAGSAALAAGLLRGKTLADAAGPAIAQDPQLDVGMAFLTLADAGLFTEILLS